MRRDWKVVWFVYSPYSLRSTLIHLERIPNGNDYDSLWESIVYRITSYFYCLTWLLLLGITEKGLSR